MNDHDAREREADLIRQILARTPPEQRSITERVLQDRERFVIGTRTADAGLAALVDELITIRNDLPPPPGQ